MINLATIKRRFIKDADGIKIALIVCAAAMLVFTMLLTFTVSDYYIFSRWAQYGAMFCISQWVKKAGIILITLAVFFNCKSCADSVKFVLPVFVVISCCLFGNFFNATPIIAEGDTNAEIFFKVNSGFPKWLNITLFILQSATMLACCALLIVRDEEKAVKAKSFIAVPLSLAAAFPLNLFENFFDINTIPKDSFLRFYNFTFWHFLAICMLVGVTVGLYYFLKKKDKVAQDKYLAAIAVTLLLQYHCKDSLLLSDGYNVYNTVIAALPLFICNIGVYVACLSVFFKKRALYAMSFFVHAVGALTVFVYFGKNDMSNYGIFCSFSILYFCITHCLLFALCTLPSALGHYKFKIKDCIIPLIYYFIVIIISSIASTLVSDASTKWVANDGVTHLIYDGVYVQGLGADGTAFMKPNFAFTQTNPLPFDIPDIIPLGGAFAYINLFYVILVYIAYVCLFFAFYGAYLAFLATRKAVLTAVEKAKEKKLSGGQSEILVTPESEPDAELTTNETAVTESEEEQTGAAETEKS